MKQIRSPNWFSAETWRSLLRALKILAPHFKEIHGIWEELMKGLKLDLDVGDMDQLACVTFEAQYPVLRAGRLTAYRLQLMKCGQSLNRHGISPAHAILASSLYLESCCTLFCRVDVRDIALTVGLTHLNAVSQSLILGGYSKQHSSNWVKVVERERRRFLQDLHDEVGHNLIVLKMYIELMARDYKKGRRKDVIERLDEAKTLVTQGINSVRRLILDLGPAGLEDLGLVPSFKMYAGQFSARTGIKVEVRGKVVMNMPKAYETALFRVFQGALSNVAKHSKAKRVQVTAETIKGTTVRMTIKDNGVGFLITKNHSAHWFGLAAMQERIETLGGRFRMKSHRGSSKDRQSGTIIDVDLPMIGSKRPLNGSHP